MKKSIQTKLFALCILLVVITSINISIPFYVLTKQEKLSASQTQIQVAFEIIRDDILKRIQDQSQKIEEVFQQVSAIPWGLSLYNGAEEEQHFFSNSTYSSYFITIGEEFSNFGRLISADRISLYGADKRILVSFHKEDLTQEKTGVYVTTKDGRHTYLSIDDYSQSLISQKKFPQNPLPLELLAEFDQEIPQKLVSEHFSEGNRLGLRIIAPISHYGEIVGVLVADTFYTESMAARYTALSHTEIIIFANRQWSIGTLPAQKQIDKETFDLLTLNNDLLKNESNTEIISVGIDDKNYYQGKFGFYNSNGLPVGAITANLLKEIEKQEIRKMTIAVIVISLLGIAISFVLAILFSRKTISSIHKLIETTSAIANGNLEPHIDTSGRDELGVLAKSFSKMRSSIKQQLTDLNNEIAERKLAEATIREQEQEKSSLEKRLLQAQKMEAIGTLAGGIAHDFNNILSVIIGYTDILKRKLSADTHTSNSLEQVSIAGNRAKNLVSQILAFSRHSTKELIPINPDLIVHEALEMLRASIPTTIKITDDIHKCGTIIADPTQFHQIVMNLCTNAYHSMRNSGGNLGITLEKVMLEIEDIEGQSIPLTPGPYIKLEISDTGHGMDEQTQLKIFEPYFTTKSKGDGTGLGLAVVHGVVESFGGHTAVQSKEGEGTTFSIYFPEANIRNYISSDESPQHIARGTEHILLVDDEESILLMEQEMLENLGYHVTICKHSPKAFEMFENHPDKFKLIITDMTMPDLTGVELIQKIQTINPDMPIILCTGFSELINEEKAKHLGISKYLMKPITEKDIAEVIREALDKVA